MNAKIASRNGRNGILVDGRPLSELSYVTFRPRRKHLRQMVEAGVRIFFMPPSATLPDGRGGLNGWWFGEDAYDFSILDDQFAMLAEFRDEVFIIPRLKLHTQQWFIDKYPGELMKAAHVPDASVIRSTGEGSVHASFASPVWREQINRAVRACIEHVQAGPMADRIIGYMLNTGGTEEGILWGVQQGLVGDFSPRGREAFRAWLRSRYGDDDALREAWRDPDARLDTVEPVSAEARGRASLGELRDPRQDARLIDYDRFQSDLVVDVLLSMCRTARDATGGTKLLGTFYGYCMWEAGMVNATPGKGHCALHRLLQADAIDFVTGITSYNNRGLGGPGSFMLPPASVQLHGKLLWVEEDLRTHLSGNLETADQAVQIYRRQFAQRLTHGTQSWYFDMRGGWYDSVELQEEFRRQADILKRTEGADMSSCAEVACVVSEQSPLYHRSYLLYEMYGRDREITRLYCDRATEDLYHSGVAVDWYLAADLVRADFSQYKAVYFFNTVFADDAQRRAIDSLKTQGRTLIFLWTPGYLTERDYGPRWVEALTGFTVSAEPLRAPARVRITDYATPLTRELDCTVSLGSDMVFSPLLVLDDPEAVLFGEWAFNGAPAAGYKEFGDWTSVMLGTSTSDCALMRAVFRHAGCTIRTDNRNRDIVMENRSLIALHTCGPGPHELTVPECRALQDLFTGTVIRCEDGVAHVGSSGGFQTMLFRKL